MTEIGNQILQRLITWLIITGFVAHIVFIIKVMIESYEQKERERQELFKIDLRRHREHVYKAYEDYKVEQMEEEFHE